jgi:hypothetical protein
VKYAETLKRNFTLPLNAHLKHGEWQVRDAVILRFFESFSAEQSITLAFFAHNSQKTNLEPCFIRQLAYIREHPEKIEFSDYKSI